MNSKKGRQVDSSIAQSYIQMIRNAENFIYIENQYFLGSAYSWCQNDDVNCHHTIPIEITQRIIGMYSTTIFLKLWYPKIFASIRKLDLMFTFLLFRKNSVESAFHRVHHDSHVP